MQLFANRGYLPNLSALMKHGAIKRLSSARGLTDDALWASFQYGTGLGDHGRYHWQRDIKNSKNYLYDTQGEDGLRAWWEPLSDAGYNIAIFDIPKAKLTQVKNGLHLTDWLVHGRYGQDVKSSPPSLAGEILQQFGNLHTSYCRLPPEDANKVSATDIADSLLQSVSLKKRAAAYVLDTGNWDIFATSFKELHCLSHLLNPEAVLRNAVDETPFLKIFEAIDAALGDLVKAAGDGAVPFIFSTTAMGRNKTIEHLAAKLTSRINRKLNTRRGMARFLSRARFSSVKNIPYNEDSFALRIQADTADEKQSLIERTEALLVDLKDCETGQPVFAHCQRLSQTNDGPRADHLPDILAVLQVSAGQPAGIQSEALGVIRNKTTAIRPGNHNGNGFIIVPQSVPAEAISNSIGMSNLGELLTQTLKSASA